MIEIRALGPRIEVRFVPPVCGIAPSDEFPNHSEAVGFAVAMGILHQREVIDRTGKLSGDELAVLALAYLADGSLLSGLTAPGE